MRLALIICALFTAVTRCAARKDLEETCFSEKSCVLSCHIQEALSAVLWSKDMLAVQWFPWSHSYHQHIRYRNRTSLFVQEIHNGNCSLTINNVKPQDSGIYKCVATSQRGEKEWLFYNLRVNALVEVVVIEQSGDVLICSSKRVHPEPECHWSGAFSNSTVQQDDQLQYSINCTTPLLRNISQYNCTVSTPFSSKKATYMQLPPITISGTEAWLRCAPSTGPVKTVSWRFNHSDVITNLSSQQQVSERWRPFVRNISESGDLRLENLTSDQQGLFTCVTSTDTESYTATMWLEMKESVVDTVNTVIAVVLTIAVLTVLAVYRCCKTFAEALASDSQSGPTAVPRDRFHAAFFTCALLGLGSALPWHFFVTASPYFNPCMVSRVQNWVLSLTVLVSRLSHLISELFSVCVVARVSPQKLTSGCLFAISLFFVAMLISIKVPMSGETFVGISMCALSLASSSSATVQRSLGVQVNSLPEMHRLSFTCGQASAGIVASVVMIVCVAVAGDADQQVFCHFFVALAVSTFALFAHMGLPCCEFAKYHLYEERQVKQEPSFELVASSDQTNNNHQEPPQSPDGLSTNWIGNLRAGLCVALVPIITFSVHPAITADVHIVHSETWGRYFIPVCCFLTFHLVHCACQWVPISWARKRFPIVFPVFVVIHLAFIPLFMFCIVQSRAFFPVNAHLPYDIVFFIIMILFSLSDGFLTQLSLVYEPNSESDAGKGISNILCTALGGTIGAALSFAFRAVFYRFKLH